MAYVVSIDAAVECLHPKYPSLSFVERHAIGLALREVCRNDFITPKRRKPIVSLKSTLPEAVPDAIAIFQKKRLGEGFWIDPGDPTTPSNWVPHEGGHEVIAAIHDDTALPRVKWKCHVERGRNRERYEGWIHVVLRLVEAN